MIETIYYVNDVKSGILDIVNILTSQVNLPYLFGNNFLLIYFPFLFKGRKGYLSTGYKMNIKINKSIINTFNIFNRETTMILIL